MTKYGPMGPPVARARPARAHVVASEHARDMERQRAAVAFEQRHEGAVSSPEKSAYAFQPPPWAEAAAPPRSSPEARASGREKPALTRDQLGAALAVADALRADGLSDDAERVLRTVLRVDPGNARAAQTLRAAPGDATAPPSGEAPGKARAPSDALGAYGVPAPRDDRNDSRRVSARSTETDEEVAATTNEFEVRLDLRRVREDRTDASAAAAAAVLSARACASGSGPRADTSRAEHRVELWSETERPLLFDRLPEPAAVKTRGRPPPPVTLAELDSELRAKRDRLAREKETDRRDAALAAARAAEEERMDLAKAKEERTRLAFAHRDALREKVRLDEEREREARLRSDRADAAASRMVHGDGDGDDSNAPKRPQGRTGKRMLGPRGRRPSPFATGR